MAGLEDLGEARLTEWKLVNTKLNTLRSHAETWAALCPSERLEYLGKVKRALQRLNVYAWCVESAKIQGWDLGTKYGQNIAAMETQTMATLIKAHVDALIATYSDLVEGGDTYASIGPVRQNLRVESHDALNPPRTSVHVPRSLGEWASGASLDIWLQEHASNPCDSPPAINNNAGKVCVILGGGSQSYLAVTDVLHQLFVEGTASLLKHHHVRAFSYAPIGQLFQSLIEDGFLDHVVCEPLITRRLAADPRVDMLHITGSKTSHDAILRFLRENKQEKIITSQLGCVTPWIVVPGGSLWSSSELEAQAKALVSGIVRQQSCNCYSPKLIIVDADWPQKETFLTELRIALAMAPQPPAYYPGTRERYDTVIAAYENREDAELEFVESPEQEGLNSDFTREGDPRNPLQVLLITHKVNMRSFQRAPAYTMEPFAPIVTICEIQDGMNNEDKFLRLATRFVNNHVYGTLSCTLIVHPSLANNEAVEKAIDELRYGCICVNGSTAAMYAAPNGVWGAHPSDGSIDLVKSGKGFVHNCLLIDKIDKAVLRLSFLNSMQQDQPGNDPGNVSLVRRGAEFMLRPNPWRLAKVAGAAMFG